MKLIDARWATEKEEDDFFQSIRNRSNLKNDFTNKWLSQNGDQFISLHESYLCDVKIHLAKKYEEEYQIKKIKYDEKLQEFELKRDCPGTCKCGGKEIYIERFNMVGCSNWMAPGEHTKIYTPFKPQSPSEYKFEYPPEPNSAYLIRLRDFYCLPKDLKPSILAEFLIMSKIELLADVKLTTQTVVNNQQYSKKREKLVRPILENKLEKVKYQQMIISNWVDFGKKYFIPDFIGKKGNNIYLIEQKNNEILVDFDKIKSYIECLKFILKNYTINYLIIVEFGETKLDQNIINFQDLSTYEFH